MNSKNNALIGNIANALAKTGDTMKAYDIANLLNQNNRKTTRGTKFSPNPNSRGMFKVLSSAYYFFKNKGDTNTAFNVANFIVDKTNKHPWKK